MSTDLTGLIPHGWAGGEAVTKWWRGKHLHLYRLRKNCAQCGKEMILDVTKAAIVGTAKNAGLHLTRCPQCRAVSKSEGGTSRPTTRSEPVQVVDDNELETLRSANATMKEELEGLYAQIKELRGQQPNPVVHGTPPASIRAYRLPVDQTLGAAVEASARAVKPINTTEILRQQWIEKNNAKMPWE